MEGFTLSFSRFPPSFPLHILALSLLLRSEERKEESDTESFSRRHSRQRLVRALKSPPILELVKGQTLDYQKNGKCLATCVPYFGVFMVAHHDRKEENESGVRQPSHMTDELGEEEKRRTLRETRKKRIEKLLVSIFSFVYY